MAIRLLKFMNEHSGIGMKPFFCKERALKEGFGVFLLERLKMMNRLKLQ